MINAQDIEKFGAKRMMIHGGLVPGEVFYQKLLAAASAKRQEFPKSLARDGTISVKSRSGR